MADLVPIYEHVSGGCYFMDKEMKQARIIGVSVLIIVAVLAVVAAIAAKEPALLLIGVLALALLAGFAYGWRFGYTRNTQYELSGTGIQTTAKSRRMCRRFSWEEVSVIQITTMEGTRIISPWDCFVFVKGKENALIKCRAMETYSHVFRNPNRIAIPKDEKTEPFVMAVAEHYGIPVEHILMA